MKVLVSHDASVLDEVLCEHIHLGVTLGGPVALWCALGMNQGWVIMGTMILDVRDLSEEIWDLTHNYIKIQP